MEKSIETTREVVRPTQVAAILEPEVYEALVERAKENERSIAAELRVAIKSYLALAA